MPLTKKFLGSNPQPETALTQSDMIEVTFKQNNVVWLHRR